MQKIAIRNERGATIPGKTHLSSRLSFFWKMADAVPLNLKIIGMVAGTAILIGTLTTFQVYRAMEQESSRQLREMSRSIARELAARSQEYILLNDMFGLTRMLKDAVKNLPDLRYAFIVSPNKEVLAHTFEGGFPLDILRVEHDTQAGVETKMLQTNEGLILDSSAPILNGDIGVVRVGVSGRGSEYAITRLIKALVFTTLGVIVLGISFSGLLTWVITRPVMTLLNATRILTEGDFSVRAPENSGDEIGQLTSAFNQMAAELEMAERDRLEREGIRKELLQKTITAQEEERKRIARELHDQVAQSLASLMLELKYLEQTQERRLITESVKRLRSTLVNELEAIHHMAVELRPSVLDDMGITTALEMYADEFMAKYGIKAELYIYGLKDIRLESYIETSLYRIVQEALTNVARHSKADTVTVIIELINGEIRGILEDNGIGFDMVAKTRNRLGIYGMEERTKLLGGEFKVESEPGQGTMVTFTIPAGVSSESPR
jgi:signal transduction histidine kinase